MLRARPLERPGCLRRGFTKLLPQPPRCSSSRTQLGTLGPASNADHVECVEHELRAQAEAARHVRALSSSPRTTRLRRSLASDAAASPFALGHCFDNSGGLSIPDLDAESETNHLQGEGMNAVEIVNST